MTYRGSMLFIENELLLGSAPKFVPSVAQTYSLQTAENGCWEVFIS